MSAHIPLLIKNEFTKHQRYVHSSAIYIGKKNYQNLTAA